MAVKPDLQDVLTMPREELALLKSGADFRWTPDSLGSDFRVSIYTAPIPGHTYALGSDFAQGIEMRDFDFGVVLDKATTPVTQVGEIEGRWGPDRYDRMLYVMARLFNNAFIVGERQFGLPVLRRLINDFHYSYLYYDRSEPSRSRRRTDVLGHHKIGGDVTIPSLRTALRDQELIVRSPRLQSQLRAFQWRPRSSGKEKTQDMRDADLKMAAPTGEFDDGVNAAAYAWKGICEVHHYESEKPPLEEGKAGAQLGMGRALQPEAKSWQKPKSVFKGYGK